MPNLDVDDLSAGIFELDNWDAAAEAWFLREPLRERLRSRRLSGPRTART